MKSKKSFFYNILLVICATFTQQLLFATNDVLMILDSIREETTADALAATLAAGLQQKAAPILVSSHILEIIMQLKQQVGADLEQFRTLTKSSSDVKKAMDLIKQIATSHNIVTDGEWEIAKDYKTSGVVYTLAVMSLIDFDNKNLNCYLHKSADIALLIPKQYIQLNKPQGSSLSLSEQARICGFNPSSFMVIDNLAHDNFLKKLQEQRISSTKTKDFVDALASCFIPQKPEDQKWVIYLIGHGGPGQSVPKLREKLENDKRSLAMWENTVPRKNDINDENNIKQQVSFYQSEVQKNESIVAKYKGLVIIPESAQSAGLNLKDFLRLIKFFDKNINTAFLNYTTCFSGGHNQTFINEVLSSLQANFIVTTEGIDENMVYVEVAKFIRNSTGTGLVLDQNEFSDYFKLLRLYTDKPTEFVRTKAKGKEPLSVILQTIMPQVITERNQPLIRIPHVGVFKALTFDKRMKILTQSLVTAHEIEKKPIDLSSTAISAIIVYPSRINVPLNLGEINNTHQKSIVSTTSGTIFESSETIHVFKEIICKSTLQSLLFNLVRLNSRLNTQTFIIKKLTGILGKESGLSIEPNKEAIIHNFIIQIKDKIINVAFELNGEIYQTSIRSEFMQNSDASYSSVRFESRPAEQIDMQAFASKFLTPQEVMKIKKPITLDNVVASIDSKIDTQKPVITPATQSQSGITNDALRNFLEQIEKK